MRASRARVVAALLGAAALLAAVLTLRGQVEPARPVASSPAPPTATSAPEPLPIRPNRRPLDWRRYPLPPGSVQVRADQTHLTVLQASPSEQLPSTTLLVISRQTGEQVFSYRPEPDWQPRHWQLHGPDLLVMELRQPLGESQPRLDETARLRLVHLGTAAVRELPVRSVQTLRPDGLQVAGEDVLVVGHTGSPPRTCVVAVRLTGSDRTVQCEPGHDGAVAFVEGVAGLRWTFVGRTSHPCPKWHELAADGSTRSLDAGLDQCPHWSESQLGEWTVRLDDGAGQPPRLRAYGPDGERLTLDEPGIPGLACGSHYYWTSFEDARPRILRWRADTDHSHPVYDAREGREGTVELQPHACTDGVLTVAVYPPTESTAAQAWVLDQP
jgi:hypothetical protein